MLRFKVVSRAHSFLTLLYLVFSFMMEYRRLVCVLYIALGVVDAYKGFLMYRALQKPKIKLKVADIKPCRRYMAVQFLLAVISFAFVFIPPSNITFSSYLCITIIMDVYYSMPLKTIFEEIF